MRSIKCPKQDTSTSDSNPRFGIFITKKRIDITELFKKKDNKSKNPR